MHPIRALEMAVAPKVTKGVLVTAPISTALIRASWNRVLVMQAVVAAVVAERSHQ
jgi:hypothetical protein